MKKLTPETETKIRSDLKQDLGFDFDKEALMNEIDLLRQENLFLHQSILDMIQFGLESIKTLKRERESFQNESEPHLS